MTPEQREQDCVNVRLNPIKRARKAVAWRENLPSKTNHLAQLTTRVKELSLVGRAGHALARSELFRLAHARGDFREPVHLVQIFCAGAQDEFVHAHVGLALDRVLYCGSRSG